MTDTPARHYTRPYDAQPDCDPERIQKIEFHLRAGDYFPSLATVLGFIEESVKQCETGAHDGTVVSPDIIRSLREELIHLHRNYNIQPKHS
ncbi:MAG TPA: hypothetical protein VFY28_01135 [Candidatus Paceibacterota bacterium]|nr:hypothetical protein [Candidatus Paceibacterota bacterium]